MSDMFTGIGPAQGAGQSRVKVNIERTASNKITRALTYESMFDAPVTDEFARAQIEGAVSAFIYLENRMREDGIIGEGAA
jgi:hypothetical protein